MSLIKCLASISLAAITLPTLHSQPRCPGNIVSLTFHLVHGYRIILPVVINHTGPTHFCWIQVPRPRSLIHRWQPNFT